MTEAIIPNLDLGDQVALVTGGSRGIGAATVKLMAAAGASVVFNYHRAKPAADAVVRACNDLGSGAGRVVASRADVSRAGQAKKLFDLAVRRFGRLDILVANAGIWNQKPAPIERMTDAAMSVATQPGATQFTRIPRGASSVARPFTRLITPPLLAP